MRDIGALPEAILRAQSVEVLTTPEDLIERAVILLAEIEKTVAEGAGAAGLAALLAHPDRFRDKKVGLVLSGGNIDTRTLANILMRGLVRDGRLIHLTVEIADKPGALAELTEAVGALGGNIVEVQHQRFFTALPANVAAVELIVEAQDEAHGARIVAGLTARGMRTVRRNV